MEMGSPEGRAVRSVLSGSVAFADSFSGYGNLVILDHGGSNYSLYGYLGSMEVSWGDSVPAGARVGTSGASPGGNPALYFELRVDGEAVDPVQWLSGSP
jgi:septal ring factor EnvC (AmiA/AmiB activator)